jgi:uncharacterized membrane protein YkvA (DUF1232 family)
MDKNQLNSKKNELQSISSTIKLNKILLIIAIIYTIAPVDLIPDAIPFIGTIDDGGVWLFNLYKVFREVKVKQAQINKVVNEIEKLIKD